LESAIALLRQSPPGDDRVRLLQIHAADRGDRYVVAPRGDLDMSTVERLRRAVSQAEATDAERIVIDLSALTFMDSSGLKLLLEVHARSQADPDRLSIIRGPRRVQRVFELTRTETALPFFEAND
jgi:anti-anti-sigma factor